MVRPVDAVGSYPTYEHEEVPAVALPSVEENEAPQAPVAKRPPYMFGFVCDKDGRCRCQAIDWPEKTDAKRTG